MKVVVHVGMHKTGSSSIQDYMSATDLKGISYASWQSPNHSPLFVLLFANEETLFSYHGFRQRGEEYCARLPEMKRKWQKVIQEDMQRSKGKTFVFSAESISHPRFSHAVQPMAEFFRQWTNDVKVIAYVRSPLSFAVSAFQQMLKGGGLSELNLDALWPSYRDRFETIERCFGRENIEYRAYDRSKLVDGDVVRDFASILGVELPDGGPVSSNTSLSAEATALLFAQRKLGDGFVSGFPKAHAANNRFIKSLRVIGSSRFTISGDVWDRVAETNGEDLKWMEDRLGMPLVDKVDKDAKVISSEEDLLDLALECCGELEDVLRKETSGKRERKVEHMIRSLDFLREVTQP